MGIVVDHHNPEKHRHHMSFHLHIPHIHFHHHYHHEKKDLKDIPKGCLAVLVGEQEKEQQRFIIPVIYINHPLFMRLLKEVEEEYGFHHKGPITFPCPVEEFRTIQDMINREEKSHHHHHHQPHHSWCFKV